MISLRVNGRQYDLDVPEEMPLLWALRDVAGLTGTKYGCGTGFCWACTVHVDGSPQRSCRMPVSEARGKSIATIESLSPDRSHALQQAWIAEQASTMRLLPIRAADGRRRAAGASRGSERC